VRQDGEVRGMEDGLVKGLVMRNAAGEAERCERFGQLDEC
jgi:hypothetical protein